MVVLAVVFLEVVFRAVIVIVLKRRKSTVLVTAGLQQYLTPLDVLTPEASTATPLGQVPHMCSVLTSRENKRSKIPSLAGNTLTRTSGEASLRETFLPVETVTVAVEITVVVLVVVIVFCLVQQHGAGASEGLVSERDGVGRTFTACTTSRSEFVHERGLLVDGNRIDGCCHCGHEGN